MSGLQPKSEKLHIFSSNEFTKLGMEDYNIALRKNPAKNNN